VKPILVQLGTFSEAAVLVGGQAVNFWAEYYAGRVPQLARAAPFTSKDIDFCGGVRAVRLCAERLGGSAVLASMDDATPNVGIVSFEDGAGARHTIDFIDQPMGLTAREVHRTAIPVDVLDARGRATGARIRVMHPVLCMESRVHNTMALPSYDTPHALKQLRASILCAREFLRDLLDAGETRAVLKLIERIFAFCTSDRDGRRVQARHDVEPFDAVLDDDRLPERFRAVRFPQMRQELARRRARQRR
jgi:hypothetical protein